MPENLIPELIREYGKQFKSNSIKGKSRLWLTLLLKIEEWNFPAKMIILKNTENKRASQISLEALRSLLNGGGVYLIIYITH